MGCHNRRFQQTWHISIKQACKTKISKRCLHNVYKNRASIPMAPVKSIPCRETTAPGTAAPVKGISVEEAEGVLEPVAPATPLVAKVVIAATGTVGTEVTPTRPTVGVAPTPVAGTVVKAT